MIWGVFVLAVFFATNASAAEIINLDEKELWTALENLPCCAANEDGTANGDPLILVFDRRSRSFPDLEKFDWENLISTRLKRLETDSEPDFDEGW